MVDLHDLVGSNDSNSTHGRFAPGGTDDAGRPWQAVRVIAVDRADLGEALLRPPTSVRPDASMIAWKYVDIAVPIVPGPRAAVEVAAWALDREPADFTVAGAIVWIGSQRYWVTDGRAVVAPIASTA